MLRLKANKTALYKLVADYVDNLPPMRSGTEFIKYSRTPDYALNWITPEWNTANAFFSTCMGHSLLSIEIRDGETGKTASRTTYSLTLRDLRERGMVEEERKPMTRAQVEQIQKPRPVWIEWIGLHQLQKSPGWEIATHVHAGRLCIKGERDKDGYLLDLYGVYWVAYDTPPGEKEDT